MSSTEKNVEAVEENVIEVSDVKKWYVQKKVQKKTEK